MNIEDFCTYEQALALTELGFHKDCDYKWCIQLNDNPIPNYLLAHPNEELQAPTLYEAQKWLRKNRFIWLLSERVRQKELQGKFYYSITDKDLNETVPERFKLFNSYEEALSAGINECINILKNG